jgi:uncharacterized repeat protein (TIGR03803 family)
VRNQGKHLARIGRRILASIAVSAATVAVIAPGSASAQTLTVLQRFNHDLSVANGSRPDGAVVLDPATGALFGTTEYGGDAACDDGDGCGTAFELAPNSKKVPTVFKRLHVFGVSDTDGTYPYTGLIRDAKGNLYGTTYDGGLNGPQRCDYDGCGTVFMLKAPATATGKWTEIVIHTFTGSTSDGADPEAALYLDAAKGVLYGTTCDGGAFYSGTVFSLTPPAKNQTNWTFAVLYSFPGGAKGECPSAPLTMDAKGNLYGTTYEGGDLTCACGTVFELSPMGKTWKATALHNFHAQSGDGAFPNMGLVFDTKGNIFGAAEYGGANDEGAIFEIPVKGGGFGPEVVLASFHYSTTGEFPSGDRLAIDSAGNLYGATNYGGVSGYGTIFKVMNKKGSYSLTVLYSFCAKTNCTDGGLPNGGVVRDRSGNLYGTTYDSNDNGLVFMFTP